MELDFREAIELMKAGKEEGFNKLYSATYNRVYARAKQCTKSELDAQDVTQITFIEAYKNISKLEAPEATLSWLYTIAYNQSCKLYRNEREKREFLLSEDTEGVFDIVESKDIESMPELSTDQKATAEIIRGIIEELPELQKMTVIAFYFDGLKLEQIAEIMDCSVNTVKSRLNYARKYIKDKVEEEEKKGGYKLHAFTLPTILFAIKLLVDKTTITAHAAEGMYAECCGELGLQASPLSLSVTSPTAAKTAAVAAGKLGVAKSLMIVGAVAVIGAGSIGGVYAYQHSKPTVDTEDNLEEENEILVDESVVTGEESDTTDADTDIDLVSDDIEEDIVEPRSIKDDLSECLYMTKLVDKGGFFEESNDEADRIYPNKISDNEYRFTPEMLQVFENGEYVVFHGEVPEGVIYSSFMYGDAMGDSHMINNVDSLYMGVYGVVAFYLDTTREVVVGLVEGTPENRGDVSNPSVEESIADDTAEDSNSEQNASLDTMIGEWTATDGTRLWIATSDGYTDGGAIEFIKEYDISWSDAEIASSKGNSIDFDYHGGGSIKVTANDKEHIHIDYSLENEWGGWTDSVDYVLTNPGYEYYTN